MIENIPANFNHPDSTPLKREEPDDFFTDKPVPIFQFGDQLQHKSGFRRGEVIGIYWRRNKEWVYLLDYTGEGFGQWFREEMLEYAPTEPIRPT